MKTKREHNRRSKGEQHLDHALSFSCNTEMYLNVVEEASKKNMRNTDWLRMILSKYFQLLSEYRERKKFK
jgi:hypothetical protein